MKKIKIQAFVTSLALLFTGCSTATIDVESSKKITNKYGYFVKGDVKDADYDEIILTMEEKGISSISNLGQSHIDDISSISNNVDSKWLEMLDIKPSSLLDNNVTNPITKHRYSKCYDKKNNSVKWEKLIDIIYYN